MQYFDKDVVLSTENTKLTLKGPAPELVQLPLTTSNPIITLENSVSVINELLALFNRACRATLNNSAENMRIHNLNVPA